MKASNIVRAIVGIWLSGKTPVLLGAPGIGKSDIIKLAVKTYADMIQQDMALKVFRGSYCDPVDLRGLPEVKNGVTTYTMPGELPNAKRDGDFGCLFLEEMGQTAPATQAAMMELLLERTIANYSLPPHWVVAGAANRAGDKAGSIRLNTAIENRVVFLDLEVDLDDWLKWAIPAGVRAEVMAFLRYRPHLIHDFDPKKSTMAYPTPRSWETVSRLIDGLEKLGGDNGAIEYDIMSGAVGEGAAGELVAFLRIFRELPDPDLILMDPSKADMPSSPAVLYALCGALAARVTYNSWQRFIDYVQRMPTEFAVLAMQDALKRNPDFTSTKEFIAWVSKNKDVIL
jgi:hypothetical protein